MAALADGAAAGGSARSGGHLSGVRDLVAGIFLETGMPDSAVTYDHHLPDSLRLRKKWDLVIYHRDALVAALDFKSQTGSVGTKSNVRLEAALGAGVATWPAQRKNDAHGDIPPWLGCVFVLREDDETEKDDRSTTATHPIDPDVAGPSHGGRYQRMMSRFVRDNIYQAGWFITTGIAPDGSVRYTEPLATATGRSFRAAVHGRVDYVRSVVG